MTGNLRVVREAGVAVVHTSEDEGIVLGEGEDFPGILALADLDLDFGTHCFAVALRRAGGIVNRASRMMGRENSPQPGVTASAVLRERWSLVR